MLLLQVGIALPLSFFLSGIAIDILDKNVLLIFGFISLLTVAISFFILGNKNTRSFFLVRRR